MGTVVEISSFIDPPLSPPGDDSIRDAPLEDLSGDALDRALAAWLVFGGGPAQGEWLAACFDARQPEARRARLADGFRARWPDCDHVLIRTALTSSDPSVRAAGLRCTGSSRYVALLGEALLGRDPGLCDLAADALARAGCARAGRFISARILDEADPMRLAALLTKLRSIPGAEVDGVLRHHLSHRHGDVRLAALHGCRDRTFAGDAARTARFDDDARVRVLAVSMLEHAEDLLPLQADTDPTVRRLVAHALGHARRA